MSGVTKHYMVEKSDFPSTSPPQTMDFRIDIGVQVHSAAQTTVEVPKGSVVYGFRAVCTEAVTSAGAATLILGFTGKTMLSADVGKATLVAGYVLGPDESADAAVYTLAAGDTFDVLVGTATLTAGKFDVTIFYHPPQDGAMGTDIKEWVTA
jgi:hypothetical protein